jgi:hypothetical protein
VPHYRWRGTECVEALDTGLFQHWFVLVDREFLRRLIDNEAQPAPSTIRAESGCRKWLEEEMQLSPDRQPRSKPDFRAEAKKKFPGLLNRQFDRAWATAIGTTDCQWGKPGRRYGK